MPCPSTLGPVIPGPATLGPFIPGPATLGPVILGPAMVKSGTAGHGSQWGDVHNPILLVHSACRSLSVFFLYIICEGYHQCVILLGQLSE